MLRISLSYLEHTTWDMSIQKKKRKNIVYSDFKCNWDPAIYLLTRVILVIKAKNVCPRLGETWWHMLHWETWAAWINRRSLSPAPGTQRPSESDRRCKEPEPPACSPGRTLGSSPGLGSDLLALKESNIFIQ